jgi:hypothetical protein
MKNPFSDFTDDELSIIKRHFDITKRDIGSNKELRIWKNIFRYIRAEYERRTAIIIAAELE